MRNLLKSRKGISLITLVIAITILLIVTGALIYNAKDQIYVKTLTNMYNDIDNLREKVSSYYSKYGAIPAKLEYTNIRTY